MKSLSTLIFLSFFTCATAQVQIRFNSQTNKMALYEGEKALTTFVFTELSAFNEGYAWAAQGGLYAFINSNGDSITPYKYEVVKGFTDGYAVVAIGEKYGIIDTNGIEVVPLIYDELIGPKLGFAVVSNYEGKWGMVNMRGELTVPLLYDIPLHYDHLDRVIAVYDGDYGLITVCHTPVFNFSYQFISKSGMAWKSGIGLPLWKN